MQLFGILIEKKENVKLRNCFVFTANSNQNETRLTEKRQCSK